MNTELAIALTDTASATLLAWLFTVVGDRPIETHLKRWSIGWALLAFAQFAVANFILDWPLRFVNPLLPIVGGAAVIFIVAGTHSFVGRPYTHRWTMAAVAGALAAIGLEASGAEPFLATWPAVVALSGGILYSAYLLWTHRATYSYKLAAAGLTGWGVTTLAYPSFGDTAEGLVWGSAASIVAQLMIGIGLLTAHLDRSRWELEQSTRRQRELLEYAGIGVCRTDGEGRFVMANSHMLTITGHDSFESLRYETTLSSLYVRPSEIPRPEVDGVATERLALWQRRDGRIRQIRLLARPVDDDGSGHGGLETLATDITEQYQIDQRDEVARRLQAIGQLAAGVAHDFNNVLTVILLNLETASAQPADAQRRIDQALTATRRAIGLTDQILAYGHDLESDHPTIDIVPHVDVLARLLRPTMPPGVHLSVSHKTKRLWSRASGADVDQILLNLVVNARDVLADTGGMIQVDTALRAEAERKWATLVVSDTGPGIDESMRQALFEPFQSGSSDRGRGLGLAIVHETVTRCGGTIEVSSRTGQGSAFEIRLPVP